MVSKRRFAMAIQAYSLSKEGYKQLSANFRVREFRCRDGSDPVFVDEELVSILQKIREHFGKPLTITSGYRTPGHNKACGGAAYSQRLYVRKGCITQAEFDSIVGTP